MLHVLFGDVVRSDLHHSTEAKAAGYFEYERARVRWFLSLDAEDLPGRRARQAAHLPVDHGGWPGSRVQRRLHGPATVTYHEVLEGRGFGLGEARRCIATVESIRHGNVTHPVADDITAGSSERRVEAPSPYRIALLASRTSAAMIAPDAYVHPSSFVDDGAHGRDGTKIWHFSHVSPRRAIGAGVHPGPERVRRQSRQHR